MILNIFNGGLNSFISPNLIDAREAQICSNVDLLKGKLSPLYDDTLYSNDISWLDKPNFYFFEGNWVKSSQGTSFATFDNKLYYSTGIGALKFTQNGSDIFDLGIDAPTNVLTTVSATSPTVVISNNTVGTSDILAGEYTYRIVYYKDGTYSFEDKVYTYTGAKGVLITLSNTANVDNIYIYRLYSSTYRLIGELTGDGVIKDLTLDISANNRLVYISDNVYVKSRQYRYTFYSSTYGLESAPSEPTSEANLLGAITISGFETSLNPIVDQVRIYRLGGDLTQWTLVGAYIDSTTQVNDTYTDIELAENDILETEGLIKPPDGMNYLTLYSSTLFASIGSKLYFSETALPNNWSELNTIQLPDQITGIGATQNGLLVFNRNRVFLLRGTNASNFSLILLNGEQGCIAHSTINYINNMLVWVSLDGICASRGADIFSLTEQKLGKLSLTTYGSVVYDGRYFLFHTTGTYVIDFRFGNPVIQTIDSIYEGGHYSFFHDKLFLYKNNDTIVEFATAITTRTLAYKTGWLSDNGVTKVKTYKKIYFYSFGDMLVNIYINGSLALEDEVLNEGLTEVMVPNDYTLGYYVELEFSGTGEVIQAEIITEEERTTYNG